MVYKIYSLFNILYNGNGVKLPVSYGAGKMNKVGKGQGGSAESSRFL
jgi:hypothetical protein